MTPERTPQAHQESTNPELMKRLIRSFGENNWEYDQVWANMDGEFEMILKSPTGKKWIEYIDRGKGITGSTVEMHFWDGDKLIFNLRQIVGTGRKGKIENHIITEPFKDEFFDPEWGYGIHYWPDGEMYPKFNLKGLPKKIDTDKTTVAFIEQVIEGNFRRPKFIRPKK